MFDKILLPVDPSKRLNPARDYAIALSEKLEVPLIATYVANPKKAGTVTASLDTRDGFAALGKRQLDQIIKTNKSISAISRIFCIILISKTKNYILLAVVNSLVYFSMRIQLL